VLYDLETEENVSARTLCRAEKNYFLSFKEHDYFIQKIIFSGCYFVLLTSRVRHSCPVKSFLEGFSAIRFLVHAFHLKKKFNSFVSSV
jgi:hypothetical protein